MVVTPKQALKNWRSELNSAYLYQTLITLERNPKQQKIFEKLVQIEQKHATYWATRYQASGGSLPDFRPARHTKPLNWLAKNLDPALVLPKLAKLEQLEADGYLQQLEYGDLLSDEQANAELLQHLEHHEFSAFIKKIVLKIRHGQSSLLVYWNRLADCLKRQSRFLQICVPCINHFKTNNLHCLI